MRGALTLEGRQTAFLLLSMMDDVADDSVPLGVYSVPGLARPPPGWAGLSSQARAYVRQAVATAETRLAVGLFVANVLFALAEVAYAFSNASVDHLTDSLRTLSDCGAPAIALYGAIMPTWRANAAHPLGYGRYEVLCAFTNVLLLVLFAVAFASSALGTLMHYPEGRPSALPPPLFATLVRLAINAVALPAFYVLLSRDAQKRAAASPPAPLPSVGAGCARRLWEALRRWLSDPRANSNVQALLLHLAAGVFPPPPLVRSGHAASLTPY
jgi:Co/Zn/Cd efflux system component